MKSIVIIYITVFVLAIMFTFNGVTYAEDVNIKLGSTGDAFRVKDPDSASLMTVLGSGNVGIGTTSPVERLDVNGNINSSGGFFASDGSAGSPVFSFIGSTDLGMFSPIGQDLGFTTGGSEKARITNDGNVGIGITSPNVALDVSGDIEYTGTITDVSDERLKDNIQPIDGALEKIQAVDGVYFNMADTPERKEIGVIAQNVQDVLPEAVKVVNPDNGYLGVSYTSLVPVLIEAIKELKAENVKLKENLLVLVRRQDTLESIVFARTSIENGKLSKLDYTD